MAVIDLHIGDTVIVMPDVVIEDRESARIMVLIETENERGDIDRYQTMHTITNLHPPTIVRIKRVEVTGIR